MYTMAGEMEGTRRYRQGLTGIRRGSMVSGWLLLFRAIPEQINSALYCTRQYSTALYCRFDWVHSGVFETLKCEGTCSFLSIIAAKTLIFVSIVTYFIQFLSKC